MSNGKLGDAWGTDEGFLDDFDFVINDAWFGVNPDAERNQDRVYLNLRGPAFVDGEQKQEEMVIRYNVGTNWEAIEGGESVENASGAVKFWSQSDVGAFVDALIDLVNGNDEKEIKADPKLAAVLEERGTMPTEAATYAGLAFHMERQEVRSFPGQDGNMVHWKLTMPIAYLGTAEDFSPGGGKKRPAKKRTTTRTKKAPAKRGRKPSLRNAVKKFAEEFEEDDFDDFVEEVLDPDTFDRADEIEEDEDLKAEILDEDGIWAEVHG